MSQDEEIQSIVVGEIYFYRTIISERYETTSSWSSRQPVADRNYEFYLLVLLTFLNPLILGESWGQLLKLYLQASRSSAS